MPSETGGLPSTSRPVKPGWRVLTIVLAAWLLPLEAAGPQTGTRTPPPVQDPARSIGETAIAAVNVPAAWVKEGAAALQPIVVTVRHAGAPVEVEVTADGGAPVRARATEGTSSVEVRVPASEQPHDAMITLSVSGRPVESESVTIEPPRVRSLWLLPHSHVDIGYTHRQAEVAGIQAGNLEQALMLAEATGLNPEGARFKWNPEAVWTLERFLERESPEERGVFVRGVQSGAVGIDALFANMLTGLCRPEELVQALVPATRVAARTGRPVLSASTCDVPGWTWGLVPLLAQAGVKYFAAGPNAGDRVGTIHQWDDRPFYWKSPSGSERVLCWVVDNYHHTGDLEKQVLGHLDRLRRSAFPYDSSFMFWVGAWPNKTVDNAPPDAQLAAKVLAWNEKYAVPRVVIGLAADFFGEFERRHGASLREMSGDLTPYWEDGAASTSRETGMNRASADRLSQAAAIFAQRARAEYPAARFQAAWQDVLLYSEHTWGADRSVDKPDDPFTLDQWRVKQRYALDADRQSRELLTAALPPLKSAQGAVDVFNTTQWDRTEVVVAPPGVGARGMADERGRPVPYQRLANGDVAFVAEAIPAFGARRYRVLWRPPMMSVAGSARASGSVLETATLRVELDQKTGAVKSLLLRESGREFVDPRAGVAVNDFRYVVGDDAAGAATNGPVRISVVDNGPLVASLRVESDAPGCNRLVREVRVIHGSSRVELVDTVDRRAVREKDGVHFGFGFDVPGGTVRMETPWAVVRPNDDQLPGSNRNWFTVQRWVDVSNADAGITLAPLDAPLVEVGAITANLMGAAPADQWMTKALESPILYSWAQNNHWHTNYKADQPGPATFRYILQPHAGGYSPAQSARFGMETSRPLVVAPSDGKTSLPGPLLSVASDAALVESVKVSDDGKGVIVRLFGVGGKAEAVTLRWLGWKPKGTWRSDVAEGKLAPLTGAIEVPAFGIVHLRAER